MMNSRIACTRSVLLKNMCSVRTKPMPVAPLRMPVAASSGVSAFARIEIVLLSSAHRINVLRGKNVSTVEGWTSSAAAITSPVVPLIEIVSPARNVFSLEPKLISR